MAVRRLSKLKICPVISIHKRRIVNKRKEDKKMQRYRDDPDFRKKIQERNRKNYKKNPAKANKRRTLSRQLNKERTNEYARKYYQSARERIIRNVYLSKRRRNPVIGIHAAILAYSNGRGEFSEVIRRIEEADKRIDGKVRSIISSE